MSWHLFFGAYHLCSLKTGDFAKYQNVSICKGVHTCVHVCVIIWEEPCDMTDGRVVETEADAFLGFPFLHNLIRKLKIIVKNYLKTPLFG